MATAQNNNDTEHQTPQQQNTTLTSYTGLTFCLFLAHLPHKALTLIPSLNTQMQALQEKLSLCEEQLRLMKSRRREDSKANARVVEIFASHRQAWQIQEKRLLKELDEANEEIGCLRAKVAELEGRVEELERDVGDRDEMIGGFMSRRNFAEEEEGECCEYGDSEVMRSGEGHGGGDFSGGGFGGQQQQLQPQFVHHDGNNNGFASDLLSFGPKFWAEKTTSLWQDVQYEPPEPLYHMKHVVARESPWKVDSENSGVSSKLKLLEQELMNVEKVGNGNLSKVPSSLRKQAKRYQALAGKIDDLCTQIQSSDPCEPTLSPEFRTQRQTEFLLEAFRLQQRASETGQKLIALQTEIGKSYYTDELGSSLKLNTRRSLDSIKNNLKEIQRNLEIWLARIIGDLEGILARDGASRVREYHMSRFPFVQ